MRTTLIHCDRCGALVIGRSLALDVRRGDGPRAARLDLCRDCSNDFRAWARPLPALPASKPLGRPAADASVFFAGDVI